MDESILGEVLLLLKNYSLIKNQLLCCTVDNRSEVSSYLNDKRFDKVGVCNYRSYDDMVADLQNVRIRQFQDFSDYFGMLSTRKIYELSKEIEDYKTSTEEKSKICNELEITQCIIEIIDSYIELLNNFPMEHLPIETASYKEYTNILRSNHYSVEKLVELRRKLVI